MEIEEQENDEVVAARSKAKAERMHSKEGKRGAVLKKAHRQNYAAPVLTTVCKYQWLASLSQSRLDRCS